MYSENVRLSNILKVFFLFLFTCAVYFIAPQSSTRVFSIPGANGIAFTVRYHVISSVHVTAETKVAILNSSIPKYDGINKALNISFLCKHGLLQIFFYTQLYFDH